mgnify:CR=1 FL=1
MLLVYARGQAISCYAEVVSEMEYILAKIGFDDIIFNGLIKKEAIILSVLNDGAIINFDSEYELETIFKYKNNSPPLI